MSFNVSTFVFEIINFLALAYILQRFLYHPLHDAIDRRRENIEQAQAAAAKAQHDAEEQRQQLSTQLAGIEDRRQKAIQDARQEGEAERAHLLAEAARGAEKRAASAREALARERQAAMQSLQEDIVHEAASLAERLLQEVSDANLDERLAGRLAGSVRALPVAEQDQLRSTATDELPATLETAHELSPQAVAQVRDALAAVLGRDVPLQVREEPELGAGVRLRLNGHVWDASLGSIVPVAGTSPVAGPSNPVARPSPVTGPSPVAGPSPVVEPSPADTPRGNSTIPVAQPSNPVARPSVAEKPPDGAQRGGHGEQSGPAGQSEGSDHERAGVATE